jgi:putative ABC transport system permease protein
VSSRYLKLVFVAFLVAIPASWFATNKWLENFAYKIELSWQTFAIAAMLTTIIASFTVSYQAIKAAMANPVKSLKTE